MEVNQIVPRTRVRRIKRGTRRRKGQGHLVGRKGTFGERGGVGKTKFLEVILGCWWIFRVGIGGGKGYHRQRVVSDFSIERQTLGKTATTSRLRKTTKFSGKGWKGASGEKR